MTENQQSAKTGDFFLVVAPGFEGLAAAELQKKWAFCPGRQDQGARALGPDSLENVEGGLLLKGVTIAEGCALNTILKIPTRILLRVASFKCRDFPKLFNKVKKLDWAPFLQGETPQVEAAAHGSRLLHKGRLEATVSEGIAAYYKRQPPKRSASSTPVDGQPSLPTIYVRLAADVCTLSIDTTGEPLYKRWPGKKVGRAPMRETLAAGVFAVLRQHLPTSCRSLLLVDPLCGSGTLLAEALCFHRSHSRQAYAFLNFPCLRAQRAQLVPRALSVLDPAAEEGLRITGWGFDRDAMMVANARHNFEHLGLRFDERDALGREPLSQLPAARSQVDALCIISNPPYGKRLDAGAALTPYFAKLLHKLHADWAPTLAGYVLPQQAHSEQLARQLGSPLISHTAFRNGGLKVTLALFAPAEAKS